MGLKDWNPIKAMGIGEKKPHKRRPTRFEVTLAIGMALTEFISHPREDDPAPMVAVKKELQQLFLTHLNNLETVNRVGLAAYDDEHGLLIE